MARHSLLLLLLLAAATAHGTLAEASTNNGSSYTLLWHHRHGRYHRRPRGGSTPPASPPTPSVRPTPPPPPRPPVPHCPLCNCTARAAEPGQGLLEVPVPPPAAPSAGGGGGGNTGIQCVGPIVSLSTCSHFLTGSDLAAPNQGGDCCNALEAFVQSTRQPGGEHLLECVCPFIIGDVNKNLAKPISIIRLMELPVACGVMLPQSILSVCSAAHVQSNEVSHAEASDVSP